MLISSHCRWPWLRYCTWRSACFDQPHAAENAQDPLALWPRFVRPNQIGAEPCRPGSASSMFSIDRKAVEHGGRLEFAANAEPGDFGLAHAGDTSRLANVTLPLVAASCR